MSEYKHIKITELTDDTLKFTLSGVDISIANGLRRIMIAEVPSVAIRTVIVKENTSVLADDYIAHRLGLIPIRRINDDPESELVNYYVCPDVNCDRCTVKLDLNVRCEGNKPILVTSDDLKSRNPNYAPASATSADEATAQGNHGISIVSLAPGQAISLECEAILGVGKQHTKWSPVGTVSMKYIPIVRLDKELLESKDAVFKQQLVDSCPRKVFAIDPVSQRVTIRNESDCMFCGDCEKLNTSYADRVVTISQVPDVFEFVVEGTGSVRPLEILKKSIEVLNKKMEEIRECVMNIKKTSDRFM